MSRESDDLRLGRAIKKHLDENPERSSVDEIAASIEASHDDIVRVLDSHSVIAGRVVSSGAGQGGGWLAPEKVEAEADA